MSQEDLRTELIARAQDFIDWLAFRPEIQQAGSKGKRQECKAKF
jgi:hypothetical protein